MISFEKCQTHNAEVSPHKIREKNGSCLKCLMSLSTIFQLYRGGQFSLVEETGIPTENHRPVASH